MANPLILPTGRQALMQQMGRERRQADRQKEDERMDKAMGLRDAMWQNEQERQKVADERYQSELAYREGRDKLADARYDKQVTLTERQMKASEARAGAAERRAAAQEARQQQEYEWQKTLWDKQLFQQENLPIIQSGWQAVAEGKDPGQQFWNVVRDPRAGSFNPERYQTSKPYRNQIAFLCRMLKDTGSLELPAELTGLKLTQSSGKNKDKGML